MATPVADSEPYRRTPPAHLRQQAALAQRLGEGAAARIGPTVWELDGPMPILKRSKTLIAMLTCGSRNGPRFSEKLNGIAKWAILTRSVGMTNETSYTSL
jgi:hypothetical protein